MSDRRVPTYLPSLPIRHQPSAIIVEKFLSALSNRDCNAPNVGWCYEAASIEAKLLLPNLELVDLSFKEARAALLLRLEIGLMLDNSFFREI